ncbi:MAG: hypothetical protein MJ066_02320 [Clostridia bacterium]|nr:hypothetical protein [Clostridia bacterium]
MQIAKLRFPFYFYRETPNSTTNYTNVKKVDDLFNILLAMTKYVSEYKTDNKKLLDNMISVLGISLYHLSSFFSKLKKEDRKEYVKTIKEKKGILKEISKKAKLGSRMTIQNKLFLIVPLVLANLLYKKRIKK